MLFFLTEVLACFRRFPTRMELMVHKNPNYPLTLLYALKLNVPNRAKRAVAGIV